jgi:hypothetical protein
MKLRNCGRFPLFGALLLGLWATPAWAQDKVLFNRDIRPILSDTCFQCHGPDKKQRKAKLRLDDRAVALKMEAIVPGKPEASELVARIFATDADERMPPAASNKKLTADQKNLLKRWIAEGAEYQGHWAYEKPRRPAVPPGVNAIDYLVHKRLAGRGLKPSARADGRTLVRRLSYDLLGLPPRPAEVQAFLQDRSPDAYDKLVSRVLASPHHGERMALGWLDVVRYADTIGYHSDNPRNVYPYRDYVIKAFNTNLPFDRFTIEQLAGDLVPGSTMEQKVASAFNRLLLSTEEGGAQARDYEARMLTDRVRAVGTVWLGQTLGCCQCHDHKFDPATMKDFYAMGAFFADIQEPILGRREDGMIVAPDSQVKEDQRLREAINRAQKLFDGKKNDASLKAQLDRARKEFTEFDQKLPRCLVSSSSKSPRTVRLLPRGNWMNETGPVMTPALPAYLTPPGLVGKRKLTRLDLAQWIASKDNPLTARVFMNRLWKQFFGIGLSKNLEDLGSQGEWPAYPELLDWLACEFMDSGWDVRHMIRVIVSSETYQQASTAPRGILARDPDNRELARQSRFRLEAELVRDQALFVSGLLNQRIGGPSVKPYQPDGYWENLNFPTRQYGADRGPDQYRRGLYTWWQRSFLHPSLLAFDAPSREECAADRSRSNIPQQALVLLNDPTYVEAARALAVRILKEGGHDVEARLAWACQQVLQRDPQREERTLMQELLSRHRQEYAANPKQAQDLLKVGFSPAPMDVPAPELAAWTSIARVLLNLHETITRE